MTTEQIFEFCNNTLLWTIIGAILGAIVGVIFTNLYNKIDNRIRIRAWTWQKCLEDGITKNPDLIVSVINDGKITIPLIDVHIMDFKNVNVSLARLDDEMIEIKPGQIANFSLKVLKTDNELTDDAKEILTASKKDFALRVYKEKSNVGPIYTDKLIADEIFRSISEIVGRDFRKRTLLDDLPFEEREKMIRELESLRSKRN